MIVPSTVGCGSCLYCRSGFFSQCDRINPAGKLAGTVFFGGPEKAGGLDGLQAEYARVPNAAANLMLLPGEIDDDQGIMMSDILPTSYQAAEMANIRSGELWRSSAAARWACSHRLRAAPGRRPCLRH